MSWVRLDDGIFYNPKIADLSDAAQLAHIKAIVYCSQGLTDGEVPARIARQLAPPRVIKELVPTLWHIGSDLCDQCKGKPEAADAMADRPTSFYIHDYLDYNPTREEVLAERAKKYEAKAEAGRAGGIASGVARRKQTRSKKEANDEAKRKQNEAPSRSRPDPVPDPQPNDDDPPAAPIGAGRSSVVVEWENKIGFLSSKDLTELREFEATLPEDWIVQAIDETATRAERPSWAYCRPILQSSRDSGKPPRTGPKQNHAVVGSVADVLERKKARRSAP